MTANVYFSCTASPPSPLEYDMNILTNEILVQALRHVPTMLLHSLPPVPSYVPPAEKG